MSRWLALLAALVVGAFASSAAGAHEVRPALIAIEQHDDGGADVTWREPVAGEVAVALRPHLDGLIDRAPDSVELSGGFSVARWRDVDPGKHGLDGRTLRVAGLERTITDVLATVRLANGGVTTTVLTPARPSLVVAGHAGIAVLAYLRLGIEHILTGADHLLFVLGLLLLSANLRVLVKTVTAFTVAHSITLALTALGLLRIDPALVEALVALSILFVAVELARKQRGAGGLTQRRPWLIAFGFGLLHGAAFAGALQEIGLPQGNVPGALFLFNLGVEAGQLLFIAAALAGGAALRRLRLPERTFRLARTVATYAIGGCATFWYFERLGAATHAIV